MEGGKDMFKDNIKFLGICVLISTIILSSTIIITTIIKEYANRYQIAVAQDYLGVLDTHTGIIYQRAGKLDFVKGKIERREIK
jgi:hypothetical protein